MNQPPRSMSVSTGARHMPGDSSPIDDVDLMDVEKPPVDGLEMALPGSLAPQDDVKQSSTLIAVARPNEANSQSDEQSRIDQSLPSFFDYQWVQEFRRRHFNREDQWTVHWYLPSLMLALFGAGICLAIGHHSYYLFYRGKIVSNSEWPLRFGIALAFITQRCFVGSVQVAYKQLVWRTLKKKNLKIDTIDRMFVVSRDPTEALSTELVSQAWFSVLLAAACWLLPLCAIAAPSSLIVVPSTQISLETCSNVASLNFSRDNDITWAGAKGADTEICYWGYEPQSQKWYYDQPSFEFKRISTLWFSSMEPIAAQNPCPVGTNCTYTVTFDGPAYKCRETADFDGTSNQTLEDLPPKGNQIYTCSLIQHEKKLDSWGVPAEWHRYNKSHPAYGVFTKEYPIWIGYVKNTTKPVTETAANRTRWPYELERKVVECKLNHAKYDVKIDFLNGRQVINSSRVEHLGPILPDGESIHPQNRTYRQFASYHATGYHFNLFMSNQILQDNASSYAYSVSDISQTTLVDRFTQLPVENFPNAIEKKFSDLVFSMLSQTRFNERINISTPCDVTSAVQRWEYHPFWLWISYAIAAGVSLLAVAAGAYAIRENGYSMDTSFSTLLATTRNLEIDTLLKGYSLGRDPLPKNILQNRLQFGEIQVDEDCRNTRHAAFGSGENVTRIIPGERYH